jgi:hypothetical protein
MWLTTPTAGQATVASSSQCPGDCNADGAATIDELLLGVRIALGELSVDRCEAVDCRVDGQVTVDEIVLAVHMALTGCPKPTASPTPTATPPQEPTAGTVLRSVHLTVNAPDGQPISHFEARFDERGERTSSTIIAATAGATLTYTAKDTAATIVLFVSAADYYTAVRVLPPPAEPGGGAIVEEVDLRLIAKDQCVAIADDCHGQSADGSFVPGEVVVGMNDWLWPDEVETALAPYCRPVEGLPVGKSISMWVDAAGDAQEAVATLQASDLVELAQIRGYDGGPVTGTAIIVGFRLGVTVNDARDLIDGIGGLRWLRIVLSPTAVIASVPEGHEGEWVCELKRAPGVSYASLNFLTEETEP